MILDRTLVPSRDKNQVSNARGDGFFDRVLDQRFIHDWEHFFRHRLGSG